MTPASGTAWLLAAAACVAVGVCPCVSRCSRNGACARDPDSRLGAVPTAVLVGYALGIVALAPLGDRLDIGLRFGLASTQAVVYALEANAQGRINTILVSAMFAAQSLGALTASVAWLYGDWLGVCTASVVVARLAIIPNFGTPRS
ncbi:MAG: hypothetical protein ABIU95_09070 [Burkholderiales bacterium]